MIFYQEIGNNNVQILATSYVLILIHTWIVLMKNENQVRVIYRNLIDSSIHV